MTSTGYAMLSYFAILELPSAMDGGGPCYRGLMRVGPTPMGDESDSPEYLELFEQYCEKCERGMSLDEVMPLWNGLGPRKEGYEIVYVCEHEAKIDLRERSFLGYDLTTVGGWNSVMNRNWSHQWPLWDKLRGFVNENGLIDSSEHCEQVLSILAEHVQNHPGTIESPDYERFTAFQIYLVGGLK